MEAARVFFCNRCWLNCPRDFKKLLPELVVAAGACELDFLSRFFLFFDIYPLL